MRAKIAIDAWQAPQGWRKLSEVRVPYLLLLQLVALMASVLFFLACTFPVVRSISISLAGGGTIVVEVASKNSFRLGVDFSAGGHAAQIESPSIVPDLHPATSTSVTWGHMTGVQTAFGALLASPGGDWIMYDAENNTILQSSAPVLNVADGVEFSVNNQNGTAVKAGPKSPCLSNGMFGPPFYYNREDNFLAYAVSPKLFDDRSPGNVHVHCYPAQFNGAPSGTQNDMCAAGVFHDQTDFHSFRRTKRHPKGILFSNATSASIKNLCCSACNADKECTAWIATKDAKPDKSNTNCWVGRLINKMQ